MGDRPTHTPCCTAQRWPEPDAEQTKGSIAESLSERLVVFESRATRKQTTGIPFTAFANLRCIWPRPTSRQ